MSKDGDGGRDFFAAADKDEPRDSVCCLGSKRRGERKRGVESKEAPEEGDEDRLRE